MLSSHPHISPLSRFRWRTEKTHYDVRRKLVREKESSEISWSRRLEYIISRMVTRSLVYSYSSTKQEAHLRSRRICFFTLRRVGWGGIHILTFRRFQGSQRAKERVNLMAARWKKSLFTCYFLSCTENDLLELSLLCFWLFLFPLSCLRFCRCCSEFIEMEIELKSYG